MMKRRPPKHPTRKGRPSKRGKSPTTKRRTSRSARPSTHGVAKRETHERAGRKIKTKVSTKKSSKTPHKKPVKKVAPPSKKRRKLPNWVSAGHLPKSVSLSFADEVRAIVEKSHSLDKLKIFERTYRKTKWTAFQGTLTEEVPIEAIPHLAKALEKKMRSKFKGAVRTSYYGVERDEEGKIEDRQYLTIKSGKGRSGFALKNNIAGLVPEGSGRFRTFRRFRFEIRTL